MICCVGGVRGYGEAGLDQNKWVEDDGVAKWRRATVREGTPDIVVSSLSYKTYARKRPTIAIVIYNKLYITLVNAQWSSDFARNCFPSFKKKIERRLARIEWKLIRNIVSWRGRNCNFKIPSLLPSFYFFSFPTKFHEPSSIHKSGIVSR